MTSVFFPSRFRFSPTFFCRVCYVQLYTSYFFLFVPKTGRCKSAFTGTVIRGFRPTVFAVRRNDGRSSRPGVKPVKRHAFAKHGFHRIPVCNYYRRIHVGNQRRKVRAFRVWGNDVRSRTGFIIKSGVAFSFNCRPTFRATRPCVCRDRPRRGRWSFCGASGCCEGVRIACRRVVF